ncbi:DUF349 domain-containing protein [Taibaiella chishuiensis]|uniref:Uncharacterized protein DUF349 n=1 Tax=Taibaiella chishuiensis TaxID=1434707 RepID=A0A2P8DA59_9BACT|nr:DUF349 domain-containing protein [Taibaiella chishuiensis]PSK94099.1 uncharacterized protein DUF349 [Taibaiella chishuiensis]
MTTQQPNAENQITPEKWDELNFDGKHFCSLNDAQEIVLKATAYSQERPLSAITTDNCDTIIAALSEKFKEVTSKLQELDTEWQQTEDKIKVNGKVLRLKEYLNHANAIGDYAPLYENLAEKEKHIQSLFDANYEEKLKLAEQAEALKDSEDWKGATDNFRAIVDHWKNANPAEKNKSDKLWERIENARNHFYERKRLHQDDVEKDMMQNLDLKMEICEKAEKLAQSEDWRKTSDLYKELMDQWKTIGRVASAEKNDELWNRFIAARNVFFDRKKVNFEQIQQEQEANYAVKLALVEKAEAICDNKDWKETTQEMSDMMDTWKKTGRVPYEKADELWNRLQAARDKFFAAKRQSAEEFKVNLEDNYAQKMALLKRAEELQHSDNWKEATDEINDLMQEWKKVGQIPREYGDEIWERFIGARNNFFARKDADRDRRKARFQSQLDGRFQQTQQFLEKIQSEIKEEEEKLNDFRSSLDNTTGSGTKEEELRKHLENLIRQIESKLPARREKEAEVARQLEELKEKRNQKKEERSE